MAANRRCVACGCIFRVRPQVPQQSYCSAEPCQRERRKLWQRDKRAHDPDYLENQGRAQASWLERHPDYWMRYRESHPAYVVRNRDRQHERDTHRHHANLAKKNVCGAASPLVSGIYRLSTVDRADLAKMDSWLVSIELIESR